MAHPAGWNHPVDQYFRRLVIKPYVLEVNVTPCMMETSCFVFKIYEFRLNFTLTVCNKTRQVCSVWPCLFSTTHIPQKSAPSFPTLLENGPLHQCLVCKEMMYSISGRYVMCPTDEWWDQLQSHPTDRIFYL